jgi:5-methylcytosine-specific restriction endonuclease McrA
MNELDINLTTTKTCANCGDAKPLSEFLRRTGRRSSAGSHRGSCRSCRKQRKQAAELPAEVPAKMPAEAHATAPPAHIPIEITAILSVMKARKPLPAPPASAKGPDVSELRPTRKGFIRMRGKTDRGRRWHQETDLETAVTLVLEHAAVVVNRHTILRTFTSKAFRIYVLTRDQYTCYFCGRYGDTIDHLLPRAKGGHTTPLNCVCACNECNQSKADRSLDEFMENVD